MSSEEEKSVTTETRPTLQDLLTFVPYACLQLEVPFRVKVVVETQGEYQRPDEKPKKLRRSIAPHTTSPSPSVTESEVTTRANVPDDVSGETAEVVVTAVMDVGGHIVELIFNRCCEIPRTIIKVIGFCIPYQSHLYKLTVRWGPLTTGGLYEFSKFLFESQITEICLDDSPVPGCNYEVLLDRPTHLRYLSLARCKLDDQDCIKLANMLTHPKPVSKTLLVLNLASNSFGDLGACAFGHTLRSNRGLQYLNLADNFITDLGAGSIFRSLMEFSLTFEELVGKRSRFFEYLKLRNEVYERYVNELKEERNQDGPRLTKRRTIVKAQRKLSITTGLSTADTVFQKAQAMTTEVIGTFADPFSSTHTVYRNGRTFCVGNLALICLNLAFNQLEHASIVMLYDVLTHQSWLGERATTGLLRVSVEGNNLPNECEELFLIDELLERAQLAKAKSSAARRGSEKSKGRYSSRLPSKALSRVMQPATPTKV